MLCATFMLSKGVEYWWDNTRQCLEGVNGATIAQGVFRELFLEKYFLEDIRNEK